MEPKALYNSAYNKFRDAQITKKKEAIADMLTMKNPCAEISIEDANYGDARSIKSYLPKQINKPFLGRLTELMSDDDARKVLFAVFKEVSKEDSEIKLSESIENAILQFVIDQQA